VNMILRCVIADHDVTVGGGYAKGDVILRSSYAEGDAIIDWLDQGHSVSGLPHAAASPPERRHRHQLYDRRRGGGQSRRRPPEPGAPRAVRCPPPRQEGVQTRM
jgi:hypothetical protein